MARTTSTGSSGGGGGSRLPRWLNHHNLIIAETLLLLGALQTWVEDLVFAWDDLPDWAKILFVMALVVGLFGSFLVVLEGYAKKALTDSHQAIQRLPIPTPVYLVHVLIFVGLFALYAWVYQDSTSTWEQAWPW